MTKKTTFEMNSKNLLKEAQKYKDWADEMEDAGDCRRRLDISIYRERAELLIKLAVNFQKQEDLDD